VIDIYGVVNFSRNRCFRIDQGVFKRNRYYENLEYTAFAVHTNMSSVCFLEKTDTMRNVFVSDHRLFFLYGLCFSTNSNVLARHTPCKNLSAQDICTLYVKYGDGLTKYVKGRFTIIVIDEKKKMVKLISDRVNLVPLYYYFSNNILVFSSSLNLLLENDLVPRRINPKAIAKFAIFNYIPGNETLVAKVFTQSFASIIEVSKDRLKEKKYWDIEDILRPPERRLRKGEAIALCNQLLKRIVNDYIADQTYFGVTFTGGYDSRALLAVLKRDKRDYFCFSYGLNGCFDILIPQEISHDLKLNYRPFLLDDDFEQHFDDFASKAVYYSDGLGSITKANILYQCERLTHWTNVVLTGLFGSELIKQPTSLGYYVSGGVRDLLFSNSPYERYRSVLKYVKNKNYFAGELFDEWGEEIFDEMHSLYLSTKGDRYSFYSFVFREGMRKYFAQELKIERLYFENRHPFLDDEFVELIFATPFAGIYNIKKNKNILLGVNPHRFYAHIIRENNPSLANYITTHGYRPVDLLSPFGMVRAARDYFRNKNIIAKTKTFDYAKWVDNFCRRNAGILKSPSEIFGDALDYRYHSREYLSSVEEYSRHLSLRLWLNLHKM